MINRRDFIKTCGAGTLTVPAMIGAKARFTLGIGTYTYRGVTVEEMIERLVALNIRQIELSSPDYMLPRVKVENIPSLKAKLDRVGIAAVSYYCGTIRTEADLDRTVQVAQALGAHHVSGDAKGEALKMIDARFNRERLKFGIHNHWFRGRKFEYQSPEDLLAALNGLSDTVGVTMDAGHMASCGYDPVAALAKLRRHLQVVHLKDVERVDDDKNVILGTGIAKSAEVIKTLKRDGFAGLVAIEYEEGRDPQADVARCVEFARNLMSA